MDTMIPVDRGGPAQPLLLASGLRKHFPVGGGILGRGRKVVRAVDDLTLSVAKGETLAWWANRAAASRRWRGS
jgi:peptide/nickel transport system ATP-binding protein